MTTLYNEYLSNLSSNIIDLNDVSFSVKYTKGYTADPNHSIVDITDIMLDVPNVIQNDEMKQLTMDSIIEKVINRTDDYVKTTLNNINPLLKNMEITKEFLKTREITTMVIYYPKTNSLCFAEDL